MKLLVLLLGSSVGFCSALIAQNLVNNGSFESPLVTPGSFVQRNVGAAMGSWLVGSGSIDHIGSNFWQAAAGGQSVDLNGPSAGMVYQLLSTTAGQRLVLRFALAGNPGGFSQKTLSVRWAGNEVLRPVFPWSTNHNGTNMGWTNYSLLLTATNTNTRLEFASLTGVMPGTQGTTAYYGPVLDDVQVVPFTPPVLQLTALSPTLATFQWNTHAGLSYRLLSAPDLASWAPASAWLMATNNLLIHDLGLQTQSNLFFRVELDH